MQASDQRRFWDQHIGEWSTSAYEKEKPLPFVERIAQPWRKHLQQRQDMGVAIASKWSPSGVLELGCGTGEFAEAFLRACPSVRRYAAFDIAEAACIKARERVRQAGRSEVNTTVAVSSVEDLDPTQYREIDVVVGLGLLPYLTDSGFEKLGLICRGKKFLFDDHPREANLFNGIHFLYRTVKRYPFYRIFNEAELASIMNRFGFGKYELIRRGPLRLIKSV